MSEINFMSNHNHCEDSNFRMRDCIIKAEDIVNRAVELGYNGVSITDHETLSAHIRILQRYLDLKKLKEKYDSLSEEEREKDKDLKKEEKLLKNMKQDFKLGLGNEIYLVNSLEEVRDNYVSGETKFWHFILIAKNAKGYEQLKRISSESAWKNWYKNGKMERVPTIKKEMEEIIGEEKGNLIAQSACLGGEVATLMVKYFKYQDQQAKLKLHNFITWCINLFGKENFYLEMQPTFGKPTENILDTEDQIVVNMNIPKLAKAYGINYVVTTDSHYLKKEHRGVHEAFLKAEDSEKSQERELGDFYKYTYMMDMEEIKEALSGHLSEEEVQGAFEGTMKVHEQIEDIVLAHDVIVPEDKNIEDFEVKHLFKDWYDKYEYINNYAHSKEKQDLYLLFMIERGFLEKKQEFTEENISRINTELGTLWQVSERLEQPLSRYYNLVRGLIHEIMWKISYVGIARGSVTGFYICYLISITQINPLKYGLAEWRHLHPSRPELPDIDIDSEKGKRDAIFDSMKEYYGQDNVLNTLTLKTEGTKSTVLTCCRGMDIDNDIASMIADMIPFERGASWSLKECFEGNEEKGRAKVTEFINEVAKYDGLKETMLLVEGLVSGRSIHASAVYVFSDGYLKQNSRMRAPNGKFITAFNMRDSDYCGGLKIDVLTIEAADKIHKTIDLLLEDGVIEDKGSIKATYDAYLHPDVLEYDDPEMWKLLGENSLIDAFQFETQMGSQAVKLIKPQSIEELAVANSLMRLMADDGGETPMATYVRYKADINLWYEEMDKWGLSEEEKKLMEKHLLKNCGVAESQELVMKLTMDEKISNFSVKEANKLRKAIAKKKANLIEEIKDLYYTKGSELGTSKALLDYVWEVQFKRQFGYSFSQNHTLPYSGICLQEMNLAHRYGKIYWNTAVLTINAGANENTENNKSTNYGKIAKAIGNIKSRGETVALPEINSAKFEFSPDRKHNRIIFGLKGIIGINDDIAKAIIDHRPYTSFKDFHQKMVNYKLSTKDDPEKKNKFGDTVFANLIKAGCFDELEERSRKDILTEFIWEICEPLKAIHMSSIKTLKDLKFLTPEQEAFEVRLQGFREYVYSKQFLVTQGKSPATNYYKLEHRFAEPYFLEHLENKLTLDKDYYYSEDGFIIVKRGAMDREIDKILAPFKEKVLNSKEALDIVNQDRFQKAWDKYVEGDISKWEMDSLCFYYTSHEMENLKESKYNIRNFFDMPTTGVVVDKYYYRGVEKPRFELSRIAGTVLDKDKNKHIVTLLTKYGVVNIKFYKGQFGFYDKQVSTINPDGSKTIDEKSWFKRGTKLLITGYRREDQFVPKKYSDTIYNHTVQMITNIKDNGEIVIKTEREGAEDE